MIIQYPMIGASINHMGLCNFISSLFPPPQPPLSFLLSLPPSPSPLLPWLYVLPLPPAVVQSPQLPPPHSRQERRSWGSFEHSLSQREERGPCPCTHSPRMWRLSPNADRSWRRRACEVCSQDPRQGGGQIHQIIHQSNFLILITVTAWFSSKHIEVIS